MVKSALRTMSDVSLRHPDDVQYVARRALKMLAELEAEEEQLLQEQAEGAMEDEDDEELDSDEVEAVADIKVLCMLSPVFCMFT